MNQTAEFKKTKKTAEALQQLFFQDKEDTLPVAFRMMVYIAQQTQTIINDTSSGDLIQTQNIFDKVQ
jgi:hypothetical protein